jgi:hypothetical protein
MMEAAGTSITSVNFYQTKRRNIPEDNHLLIYRRENLKSHQATFGLDRHYVKQRAVLARCRSRVFSCSLTLCHTAVLKCPWQSVRPACSTFSRLPLIPRDKVHMKTVTDAIYETDYTDCVRLYAVCLQDVVRSMNNRTCYSSQIAVGLAVTTQCLPVHFLMTSPNKARLCCV